MKCIECYPRRYDESGEIGKEPIETPIEGPQSESWFIAIHLSCSIMMFQ